MRELVNFADLGGTDMEFSKKVLAEYRKINDEILEGTWQIMRRRCREARGTH
jgi:hypothetical protein